MTRSLLLALWLALALVSGQHLSLAHDFAHAAEKLSHKQDSKPGTAKCDQHIAAAQFVGAASVHGAVTPAVATTEASHFVAAPSAARPTPAYRAQAPPTLL